MATPLRIPSLQTAPPSAAPAPRPRPLISPAERDYLISQGNAILMHGGSEQDVVNFVSAHRGRPASERRESVTGAITERGGMPKAEAPALLGLTLSALNGATFGFGDEAFGTLAGVLSSASAAEGREAYRALLDDFRNDHGVVSFLTEMAGGLATGAMAARAVGLGAGIGAQALAGGAGGAVSGAANTQGTLSDRAKGALFGGTLGAGLGGAVTGIAHVAGPTLREGARGVLNRFEAMLGRGATNVSPSGVARLRPPSLGNEADVVRSVIRDMTEAEGLTTDGLRQRALAMQMSGVNPTLADVVGDGGLALLSRTMGSVTPIKRQILDEFATRQASQGARLSGSLYRRLFNVDSFGLSNAYALKDELAATMRSRAQPLYRAAHREVVPLSPRIQKILEEDPIFRAAYEEAKPIAARLDLADDLQGIPPGERGLPIPELPKSNASEQMFLRGMLEGDPSPTVRAQIEAAMAGAAMPSELPVRALDLMQRGVRKVVRRLQGRGGIDAAEYKGIQDNLQILLEDLRGASPTFRAANNIWAGGSAAQDAIDLARGRLPGATAFHAKAPEIVEREIRSLVASRPGLVEFYRVGVMQDLDDVIRGPMSRSEGADVARDVFGARTFRNPTDNDIRRIRALFPGAPDVADDFTRRVFGEGRLSRTAEALAPERIRAAQNPEKVLEGSIMQPRMTAILTALGAARDAMMRGSKSFQSRVSDEMARAFSYGMDGFDELDAFLETIDDFAEREEAFRSFGRAAQGGISGVLGLGVGAAVEP